jgi:hypothetical protein
MLEANAYNNSILLMVATPYTLLGLTGLAFFGMTWWAARKNGSPRNLPHQGEKWVGPSTPPAAPGESETGVKEEPRP